MACFLGDNQLCTQTFSDPGADIVSFTPWCKVLHLGGGPADAPDLTLAGWRFIALSNARKRTGGKRKDTREYARGWSRGCPKTTPATDQVGYRLASLNRGERCTTNFVPPPPLLASLHLSLMGLRATRRPPPAWPRAGLRRLLAPRSSMVFRCRFRCRFKFRFRDRSVGVGRRKS